METEIRTAIYELTKTAESLDKNNLFWGQAKQGTDYPFCVISLVTNPQYRDTGTSFDEYYLQFTLYGDMLADLETIEAEICAIWDYCKTAIDALLTNWQYVGGFRQHRENRFVDDKYWQNFIRYKLELEPKI